MMRPCPHCGAETMLATCIACQRKHDKLKAAAGDVRSGRKSLSAAVGNYGVTSVELVQWMARRHNE